MEIKIKNEIIKVDTNILITFSDPNDLLKFYRSIIDEEIEIVSGKYNEIESITDLLSLSLNQRTMINHLHKKIISEFHFKELYEEINLINDISTKIMKKINEEILLDVECNEIIKIDGIIKLLDVRFKERKFGIAENLEKYIQILTEISNVKYIFIYGSRNLFSMDEIEYIHNSVNQIGIFIVWFEYNQYKSSNYAYDQKVLITENVVSV